MGYKMMLDSRDTYILRSKVLLYHSIEKSRKTQFNLPLCWSDM